jgi:DNA polymerase
LLGRTFRLTQRFGELQTSTWAESILATYHPAAVLRAPKAEDRERMRIQLFKDVQQIASVVAAATGS